MSPWAKGQAASAEETFLKKAAPPPSEKEGGWQLPRWKGAREETVQDDSGSEAFNFGKRAARPPPNAEVEKVTEGGLSARVRGGIPSA